MSETKKAKSRSTERDSSTEQVDETMNATVLDEREQMIAEAAYFRAEQRGFQGGDPQQDWIMAEKEIDTQLTQQGESTRS